MFSIKYFRRRITNAITFLQYINYLLFLTVKDLFSAGTVDLVFI